MVAELNWALGESTRAWICRVATAPFASVPTFHRPEEPSYVPWLLVAPTRNRPPGSRSVTWTLVAASGPALVRVTVKVMVSPTLGGAWSTDFSAWRRACWGVSVALALLLAESG